MRKARKITVAGGAAIAAAATAFTLWPGDPAPPKVSTQLRTQLTPVIQRHLETEHVPTRLESRRPRPTFRTFCTVRLVETRQGARDLLAGITAHCTQAARRGTALVLGTGFAKPMLITMRSDGGAWLVLRVTEPEDGAGYAPTLGRMFSKAGAAEVGRRLNGGAGSDDLYDRARRALGLPANAPVKDE